MRIGDLLIQWNREPNGGSRWITFPVGYPSAPYVFCQAIETTDQDIHAAWAIPYQISQSNFYCVMRFASGVTIGHATGEEFFWLAIGPSS
jgi:hypothetical protein